MDLSFPLALNLQEKGACNNACRECAFDCNYFKIFFSNRLIIFQRDPSKDSCGGPLFSKWWNLGNASASTTSPRRPPRRQPASRAAPDDDVQEPDAVTGEEPLADEGAFGELRLEQAELVANVRRLQVGPRRRMRHGGYGGAEAVFGEIRPEARGAVVGRAGRRVVSEGFVEEVEDEEIRGWGGRRRGRTGTFL
ncbi:hypothetical protein HPP92_013400 [Vanilla planifolia]|uniref:Uncharacterized protein n=1 Tax=Vanilla planifolia TaxID=51239 RepID=A0A835QWY8_VANPL|nr:hypothetical protein HPP92_013400 [Vanilla planifolia]